jgi:hypothetical protein
MNVINIIDNNEIENEGAKDIGEILKNNTNLITLDLSN